MVKIKHFVIWIQAASLFIEKQKIVTKTLQILKQGFTLQILNQPDHCLKEKIKKVIGLMKDEYDGKIMEECFRLRAKAYIYLKENNDEDKKQYPQNSAP